MRRMEDETLSCPHCNSDLSKIPSDIQHCLYCGKGIERRVVVIKRNVKKPSTYWYLVPFLFGVLGGIIAYFLVKDDDRNMARNLLLFGICMSAIWYMIYVLINAFVYYIAYGSHL